MACKDCKWSELEKTPTGRFKRQSGRCMFPIKIGAVPWCAKVTIHAHAVWPNDGEDCPTFEPSTPHSKE